MSAETVRPLQSIASVPHSATRQPGLTFPIVVAALYWGAVVAVRLAEIPYFFRFLFSMAAPATFLFWFSIWWWRRSNIPLSDRALGYALVLGGAVAIAPLTHVSFGLAQTLMSGLPIVMTVWTVWVLFAERQPAWPRLASVAVALIAWSSFTLFRMEGLDGDLRGSFAFRWSPTAEEVFLASQSTKPAATPSADKPPTETPAAEPSDPLKLAAGDWPEFRGTGRTGTIAGVTIDRDWSKPPKLVWKQRIGPAWSSVIVIGDRLFTQEQRGEQEAVVCYEASTGRELWVHQDKARFWEAVAGAGPRSTPTFAEGRLVTLGATGILNCLDAVSGKRYWMHDLATDAKAQVPMWGISSSPLVVGNLVIAYGGGEKQHNLLAYDLATGSAVWTAEAGDASYSSPQLATVRDQPHVLMYSDAGLTAFEPASGTRLWHGGLAMPGAPRSLQVHPLPDGKIVAGVLNGMGIGMIEVTFDKDAGSTKEVWSTSDMKCEFSELVAHKGHLYGFDGAIFCCLDASTGKRTWKKGRYGRGQVVLLAEDSLLVVLSETGELVLVRAQSDQHEEVGRFQAIAGKTWNHPVITHGRLYARNAEEIACYELDGMKGP